MIRVLHRSSPPGHAIINAVSSLHFSKEESLTHRDKVACPKEHSGQVSGQGLHWVRLALGFRVFEKKLAGIVQASS